MRICVTGPSGAGKSTLCKLLHSIYPSSRLINGDDYIGRDRERVDELVEQLDAATSGYIFEHVSVVSILKHVRNKPDYVAILLPPQDVLAQQRVRQARSSPPKRELSEHSYLAHAQLLDEWGVAYEQFCTSGEALAGCAARLASELGPVIQNFVLKVSSRCNLNCDYCYMYQGFDVEWKKEPALMSKSTALQIGVRISDYLAQGRARSTSISFHGGEPLLLSPRRFAELASAVKVPISSDYQVRMGVQTNGVRLSTTMLRMLDDLGFNIGVSIDGASEIANQHRVDHDGRSTFRQTEDAISRLASYQFSNGSFGGVLCVINPLEDGATTYRYLRSLGVRNIDFLLPDYTHDNYASSQPARGIFGFLRSAFDAWIEDADACNVRLFQSIIALLFGDLRSTDMFGLGPPSTLVVSASGNWELLDTLRVVKDGAWRTTCNVFSNSVADVLKTNEFQSHFRSKFDLADKCIACRYCEACGGGYLPQRFSNAKGFKNPTIYCSDLLLFFEHVVAAVARQTEPSVLR